MTNMNGNDHNGNGHNGNDNLSRKGSEPIPYKVTVSRRFLLLSLISSSLLAFAIGAAARVMFLEGPLQAIMSHHGTSPMKNRPDHHSEVTPGLPQPVLQEGKTVPRTIYSAKHLDTAASVTSSTLLKPESSSSRDGSREANVNGKKEFCAQSEDGSKQCSRGGGGAERLCEDCDEDDDDEEEEEAEHLPAGQHLLIDIKHVDAIFLNSELRLAKAMIELVAQSQLTLLSYHCHSLTPTGVSCVGVLLESHVSFHTWPEQGVITLDLFTCGSNPLIPVLPDMERLFGVPRSASFPGEIVEPPTMKWAHKLRGFRPPNENPLSVDLGDDLCIMNLEMKRELVSVETPFQRIDVWEFIRPKYDSLEKHLRSLSNDGSYESQHPEFFQPDRLVFLDGVMQSCLLGDAPYHEPLVHPAMFSHPNPKRVAIVGGGEGATLREVLKHSTVKDAIMVEIDEIMVNVSHEHIPSWSDCSDLIGSADWCVEDPRANMYYEDALAWFINRFNPIKEEDRIFDNNEPMDVIIMDALDPEANVPFADVLYNNDVFLQALWNALTDDGIIVLQLGEGPDQADARDSDSLLSRKRARFIDNLVEGGFESLHVYEDAHGGFEAQWLYLVAFKNRNTRLNWYATPAQIDLQIHKRIVRTRSGRSPLLYFDGGLMAKYQNPPKAVEVQYCKQIPTPSDCSIMRDWHSTVNVDGNLFEIRENRVYAKIDIPVNSRLECEEALNSLLFSPQTMNVVDELSNGFETAAELKAVSTLMAEGGVETSVFGAHAVAVDTSSISVGNKGGSTTDNCKGPGDCQDAPYNPVAERNIRPLLFCDRITASEIKAGEEIVSAHLRKSI